MNLGLFYFGAFQVLWQAVARLCSCSLPIVIGRQNSKQSNFPSHSALSSACFREENESWA